MRFGNRLGFYELNPFPGCNQLVVSNHAFIHEKHRGKGHGKMQHRERLEQAFTLGYDAMICTVCTKNTAEKEILMQNKWSHLWDFRNSETGNLIEVWVRDLYREQQT